MFPYPFISLNISGQELHRRARQTLNSHLATLSDTYPTPALCLFGVKPAGGGLRQGPARLPGALRPPQPAPVPQEAPAPPAAPAPSTPRREQDRPRARLPPARPGPSRPGPALPPGRPRPQPLTRQLQRPGQHRGHGGERSEQARRPLPPAPSCGTLGNVVLPRVSARPGLVSPKPGLFAPVGCCEA